MDAMNVDLSLVEKITKMVLSELQDWKEPKNFPPLTKEELEKWQEISLTLHHKKICSLPTESERTYLPLTEDEVKRWSVITAHFVQPTKEVDNQNGQVKFYRTYN